MTAVPAANPISDHQWYVEHLLPWPQQGDDGCIVVSWSRGQGPWLEERVYSPDEAVSVIRRADADPSVIGVFACQALMQGHTKTKRSSDLALTLTSVWLDLDAKDFRKANEDLGGTFYRMVGDLKAFRTAAGLPYPSVMIWSGGGIHAYWLFDRPVAKERWTGVAGAMRAAVEQFGLPADVQCTTDAARVLRIPGTENRKPEYGKPLPVELMFPGNKAPPIRYEPDNLKAALAKYLSAHPATPKNSGSNVIRLDPKLFPRRAPLTGPGELSAGLEVNVAEIHSAVMAISSAELATEGGWMTIARGLAHTASIYRAQAEELWAVLNEASRRAPGYDEDDNRQRWERYIEEAQRRDNPTTIATIFAKAKEAGWQGWSPPTIVTSQGNGSVGAPSGTADRTVRYAPGTEEDCRQALDQIVAADERVFTLEGSGHLSILRVPEQDTQLPLTQWDGDLPGTTLATVADIMERAERLNWLKPAKGFWVRTHPPQNFVANYLQQMRGRYSARALRGIARVPRIDDDGKIFFPSGYDPITGLYHDKTPSFDVRSSPSRDDALKALKALLLPFSEYKFEDQAAGDAVLTAAIFTALERPWLATAPMLIVRSSMAGTGKGLLVRSLVQLAYDTVPIVATWGATPEETEKRIASLLLMSPGAICIDNANGKMIQGDLLESIITEGRADIRILGRSEIVRVRNRSLILLTGNNPQITGDMARRTLALDIIPRSADPERDRYSIKPVEFIQRRRTDFLRAAFTIMRAYRIAGMPAHGLPAVGSFDAWSRRVRDLVYWITGHDLADAFRQNKAEDPYRQDDATLLGTLETMYSTIPFRSSDVFTVYFDIANSKRMTQQHGSLDPKKEALHAALDAVLGGRGVSAKQFGYWARRVKGAHIGGFQLDVRHDPATNSNAITVRRT